MIGWFGTNGDTHERRPIMDAVTEEARIAGEFVREYHTPNVVPETGFVKALDHRLDWVERRHSMGFRTRTNPEPLRNKIGQMKSALIGGASGAMLLFCFCQRNRRAGDFWSE